MSWVTGIWSFCGGACLALGLKQIALWSHDRNARASLAFSGMALSVAAMAAFELAMMRASTLDRFGLLMRWIHVPVFVLVVCLVIFVRLYFGTGGLWLGSAACGLRLVSLVLNLILLGLSYPPLTSLGHVEFLGERVSVAKGVHSWLLEIEIGNLSSLLLLAFVVDASVALWRRGGRNARRRAAVVGGSVAIFIVIAAGLTVFIRLGVVHAPCVLTPAFLVFVVAMSYELVYDHAGIRRDLDERLRLQALIASAGTAFVNVAPYQVDEEIEKWMRRMITALDADRIGLFEFTGDHNVARNTHQATREGVPNLPQEFSYDEVPWYLGEIRAARPVVLSDVLRELPPQATAERELATKHRTRALMGFPVAMGGAVVRGIDCVTVQETRVWSEAAQNALRSVGQIFAHALAERQAEIALRESEQRFRIVADSAPVLIWMSGPDKLCTFFNKTWLEFTGRTLEQEMGNGWAEGVHPDDLQCCLKTYAEAFDGWQPFVMQYRLRRYDGEYRWVSDNGVPRYDDRNNFAGYIGSCVDVTESISNEQALRESEERMSLVIDAANLGLWEWNVSKDELWGSKARRALLGLPTAGKIKLEEGLSAVHVDDRDRVRQTFKDAVRTGENYHVEYRVVLPGGSVRWTDHRGRCVKGVAARDLVLRGISMDVTEQKRAEEKFRLAVEASPSGILLVNQTGQIVLVNAHIEELFGYGREELIGQSVEILVPERFASKHPEYRANFLAAPTRRAMGAGRELFGRRKDGSEFPVEIGLNPIETPDGILVLASVVDISARKRAEEEAQLRRAEINRLTRVSLLGEMAGSIAHEVNQPLGAMMANASAMIHFIDRGHVDAKQLREILSSVVRDGRRASDVIGNIRDTIKKGTAAQKNVALNDIVRNVMHMVQPDAAALSCDLRASLAEHLPTIDADPVQIQQVLINLLGNAFDAMRDISPSKRKVEIATELDAGSVRVSVRDHGLGIGKTSSERLFEQFYTTKEDGLGMGLAIVRSIIQAHSGTISAENAEGGGARFVFGLPAGNGSLE